MSRQQQQQGKKGKKQRKHRVSSGKKRVTQARQELLRIKMKIKRWKKNQTNDMKKHVSEKSSNKRLRSRHKGWNTEGLEKRVKQLESKIKLGPKRYIGSSKRF